MRVFSAARRIDLFLVTGNKRFFGYDRGLFWVFVLGYLSYGEKIFGPGLVFLVTWDADVEFLTR